MASYKEIRASLDYILKNGDIHDAITKRKNTYPSNHPFLRANILALSRLLYAGVLIYEKINSHFVDVDKVVNAQKQIREHLGFNVDIIRSKEIYDYVQIKTIFDLAVLYYEYDLCDNDYIGNLKKLLEFADIFKIKRVILGVDNIFDMLSDKEINLGTETSWRELLNIDEAGVHVYNADSKFLDFKFLMFTVEELRKLIVLLDGVQIDKSFLDIITLKINDEVVLEGIKDFLNDHNVGKLQDLVLARLILHLNEENVIKDKGEGKVYYNTQIIDDYIRIREVNVNGEIVSDRVLSLYDYLEVNDLDELVNKIDDDIDAKEIRALSSLYLFLGKKEAIVGNKTRKDTVYDSFYSFFKDKQKTKSKKRMPYVFDKFDKGVNNFLKMVCNSVIMIVLIVVLFSPCLNYDLIQHYFFNNPDSKVFENIINTLVLPYKYGWNLEKKTIEEILAKLQNDITDTVILQDFSVVGDSKSANLSEKTEDKPIAWVDNISLDEDTPDYFAVGFGTSASYKKGNLIYDLELPVVDYDEFGKAKDLFSVKYEISSKILKSMIKDHTLSLYKSFYPLGDQYTITKIVLKDTKNSNKFLEINYERAWRLGGELNPQEEEMLLSMEDVEVTVVYGINELLGNLFVNDLYKDQEYNGLPLGEARAIVVDSLGLNADASLDEILSAIRNKTYSETPIEDAGLSNKIKRMDEEEYFKSVASLDSLICNLAATLVVEVDSSLVYTVGYVKDEDGTIKLGSAHAWATDLNGNIIDATPSVMAHHEQDSVEQMLEKIIMFGIKFEIPLVIVLILINAYLGRKFGKKIALCLKIKSVDRLLSNQEINDACARIRKYYYGGINLSTKDEPYIIADKLIKDFAGLSDEELKKLADELIQEKDYRASQVVKSIPFMRENKDVILRELRKNKQES